MADKPTDVSDYTAAGRAAAWSYHANAMRLEPLLPGRSCMHSPSRCRRSDTACDNSVVVQVG
jgi:hypothetical protein